MFSGFRVIYEQTKYLASQNEQLRATMQGMSDQIQIITGELMHFRKEREEREEQKRKLQQRKQLELANPIYLEHYEALMALIGPAMDFQSLRLRVAYSLMFITGMRIGELNNIQFKELKTLLGASKTLY